MIYDFEHQRKHKRNGNGIYQDRNGLRQFGRAPDLGWWRERLKLTAHLRDLRFDPMRYVVPGLIPEGVTLLAGRPKIGKSWLLLQIACAVAFGNTTLIADGEAPPFGHVLLLALEDSDRRLQRRLTKYYGTLAEWPPLMEHATQWLRLDEGGLDGIGEWCLEVPNPRLIIIDTLARVRPPKRAGQTDYEADMEAAEGLMRLCREHPGLSVIIAHHDRKQDADDPFDTISGTLGIQGGVDTLGLLKRSGQGTILYVKGRDLEDDIEKAVNFDRETCRWHILGEAAAVHQSDTRKSILELLRASGSITPREVTDQLEGMNYENAKKSLQRMARDGLVERTRRGYHLRDRGDSGDSILNGDSRDSPVPVVPDPLSPDDFL